MNDSRLVPGLALALVAAYTQPDLYYSNQNQYYLHGAALAGHGDLARDWLANTRDPTPLFTAAVALFERTTPGVLSWLAFAACLIVYFRSLWELACASGHAPESRGGRLLLGGALVLVHSSVLRHLSVEWLARDYPWYFQAGIANQYVLGAGFQPSVVGVFLLAALASWANGRPRLTALAIVIACLVHSTYLLPGALLVLGVLAVERSRRTLRLAATTLLGVLPVVVYAAVQFDVLNAGADADAVRKLIADQRIPHHADPTRFLDPVAWAQLAWVAAGLWCVRHSGWGRALLVATGLAIALTIVRVATDSASLALLFPWRISAILVPLATVIVFARAARLAEPLIAAKYLGTAATTVLAITLAGTAWLESRDFGYMQSPVERGVQEFVRASRRPGDVYLLPVKMPVVPEKLTIKSESFVPLAAVSKPFFELQSFRLTTGAAVYGDYKSIPYATDDVIEWRKRIRDAERWYAERDWDDPALVEELKAAGITHALIPTGTPVASTRHAEVYRDEYYRVVRLE